MIGTMRNAVHWGVKCILDKNNRNDVNTVHWGVKSILDKDNRNDVKHCTPGCEMYIGQG